MFCLVPATCGTLARSAPSRHVGLRAAFQDCLGLSPGLSAAQRQRLGPRAFCLVSSSPVERGVLFALQDAGDWRAGGQGEQKGWKLQLPAVRGEVEVWPRCSHTALTPVSLPCGSRQRQDRPGPSDIKCRGNLEVVYNLPSRSPQPRPPGLVCCRESAAQGAWLTLSNHLCPSSLGSSSPLLHLPLCCLMLGPGEVTCGWFGPFTAHLDLFCALLCSFSARLSPATPVALLLWQKQWPSPSAAQARTLSEPTQTAASTLLPTGAHCYHQGGASPVPAAEGSSRPSQLAQGQPGGVPLATALQGWQR